MGLMARWKMDETSGTTFADSSGNGRDMALVGTATLGATKVSSDADVANRSLQLVGGNWVRRTASDSGLANLVDNFTIGGWVRYITSNPDTSTMLLGREYDGSTVPWMLGWNRDNAWGGRWGFGIYNGTWRDCLLTYDLDLRGQDVFLVGTFGGGTMRFYLNGGLYAVTTGITPANPQAATVNTVVGRKWDQASGQFGSFGGYGRVDDLFVMDEVLNARQVRELYKDMAQITGTIPSASQPPQGAFQQGGWTFNNYSAAASATRLQVGFSSFGNEGRSAYWVDPVTLDGYTIEWQTDIQTGTGGGGGLLLSYAGNPWTNRPSGSNGQSWGALKANGIIADRNSNLTRLTNYDGNFDYNHGVQTVVDNSLSGVNTWNATFTRTTTNTFTIVLLKNNSAYATWTGVNLRAETFHVGFGGSTNGSPVADVYIDNVTVTPPAPPTPTQASTRLKRPLGFAARRRAVA